MRINFKRKYYTSREPTQEMQNVYKYICDNPGTTAYGIAKGLSMKNYRRVYEIIASFEGHGMLVSEDAGKYYPFDLQKLDNQFWMGV